MTRAVLTTAILLTLADPAAAFQTDVDADVMTWKREGLARWRREEAKAAWLADVEEAQTNAEASYEGQASPATASSTTYAGGVLSAEQVAAYARGAGFPENVIPTMVAIAWRESRFDPGAVNGSSGACGLWQMYPCPGAHALDPATNAALAYAKYAASGLAPWGY